MSRCVILPYCPYLLPKYVPPEIQTLGWDLDSLLTDCLYWDIEPQFDLHELLLGMACATQEGQLSPPQRRQVFEQYSRVDGWIYQLQHWMLSFSVVSKHQYHQMKARIVNTPEQRFIQLTIEASVRPQRRLLIA